ncbi:MAG TPA: AI-2E family transporter [Candidatus Baltobacteraceae bacterium]|nr:AI-2E family transporter [Candidatus Baltobacteraceae bacterium]
MTPLARAAQTLLIIVLSLVLLVAFVDFIGRVHTVATVAIGAIFLCYAIYPAVRRLQARFPLWLSILVVYVGFLACVAIVLAFAVPAIVYEVRQFSQDAPALAHSVQLWIADPRNPVLAHLPPQTRDQLLQIPAQIGAFVSRDGAAAATNVLHVLVSTVSVLALFVIIPVVAIYMLLDTAGMYRSFMAMIPERARPRAAKILREIDDVMGGFIRGQLLVAAIVGVLIVAMLALLHVRYAVAIGVTAGLLEIIPYVGAVAGAIPALAIALITNGPVNASLVLLGFIVINQLEGHVISPLVVSGKVGLSPLAIVLALLTGGELFGLPGLFLAVPVAGIIRVLIVNLVMSS